MGGDGTRPSGADFPLPPPRPSGSSISTETPSRSSSDTSPSHTTGSEPSVRQHVIRRVSVRHRKTPSSFDRSIDISMMGGNGRDYCCFFSLKRGDFSEDARLLTPRRRFFRSFSSKKFPSPRMKRKKKLRNIHVKIVNIRYFSFNSPYIFPSSI